MNHRVPFVSSRRQFLTLVGSVTASGVLPFRRGVAAAGPLFEEIPAAVSGISWVHENAMSSNRYLPETMGPGVAFFDYDNDGWLDIFMVNSGGPVDFWKPATPIRNALYKNNRDGTFTDVTAKTGVTWPDWSTSAVWFDYDNDGKLDLFVCSFVEFSLA